MKQHKQNLTLMALFTMFFLSLGVSESMAQRQPVTTQPSHRKGDCKDKIESSVTKTPWKLSQMGFIKTRTTPIDTTEIDAAATLLYNAVGGNLGNYQAIVDTVKGWMSTSTFELYFQFTRSVTIVLKEWKCRNGVLVLVRDINRTFEEKTPWFKLGPWTAADMSVKRIKSAIEGQLAKLPTEYEGPIE